MSDPANTISFQGMRGAYSMAACRSAYPDMDPMPCRTFVDAFEAVETRRAALAMIPIDNSVAGRVADIHHLMPGSGLHIVAEHFQRVNHQLLALPGTKLEELTHVHSHVHALNQCRKLISRLGIEPVVHVDTAGAAEDIVAAGDKTQGAISSELAAELNGLQILRGDVEDAEHNTTRFFATNGVNMTKLESYVDGEFNVAQFYADVEGHPEQRALQLALEELGFFTDQLHILGTYPAHPFRRRGDG